MLHIVPLLLLGQGLNARAQACPLFPFKDSLELMLRRPAIVKNLSYDNVPDCAAFNEVQRVRCMYLISNPPWAMCVRVRCNVCCSINSHCNCIV
jgi:hypothetical protein